MWTGAASAGPPDAPAHPSGVPWSPAWSGGRSTVTRVPSHRAKSFLVFFDHAAGAGDHARKIRTTRSQNAPVVPLALASTKVSRRTSPSSGRRTRPCRKIPSLPVPRPPPWIPDAVQVTSPGQTLQVAGRPPLAGSHHALGAHATGRPCPVRAGPGTRSTRPP